MRIKVWLSILLCIGMLAGCSFPLDSWSLSEDREKNTLGLTPDFSYSVEQQTPNILINQLGYRPEDSKVAILQGRELSPAYYVYHTATDTLVFTGSLKEAGLAAYGEDAKEAGQENRLYTADFSDLEEEGSYYLFHEELGYSDPFLIENDIYLPLESHILEQLAEENRDTSGLCYQLAGMLMTQELYGEQIQEIERFHQILEEKIQLLMRARNQETGGVYETIEGTNISLAATAEFAGVMAMYAGSLKGRNENLAVDYQRLAEEAYGSIRNSLDNVSYDAGYFAVTQLFKQTGKKQYAQAISQYLSMKEEQKSYTRYDFSLFGDFAYLSCSYGVNLEWSRQLMNKVMKQAENISLTSSRDNYYLSHNREHYQVDGILRDMSVMALVNYIIPNHEYTTLQKNYLDYLLGRNPGAVCLAEGFGSRNISQSEMVDKENAALFYLLLQSTK